MCAFLLEKIHFTALVSCILFFVGACGNDDAILDNGNSDTPLIILNPTPAFEDRFGWSLSSSGDNVAIGAPFDGTTGAFQSGAVYLFNMSSGTQIETYFSPNPTQNGLFGLSVFVSSDYVLIGAPGDTTDGLQGSGAAYLYESNTGKFLKRFQSPQLQTNEQFGSSVALVKNNIIVGTTNFGKAYQFNADTGALIRNFTSPAGNENQFGWPVAPFGMSIIIGARKGSIHIFDLSNGNLLQTLTSPDIQKSGGLFGISVSSNGENIIVGSPIDDLAGKRTGATFLFNGNSGSLQQTFLNPTPEQEDMFGYGVALIGDIAIIGASGDNTGQNNAGSVYLFDANTGALLKTISNPTPNADDNFGFSLTATDNKFAIGAWGADDSGASKSGAVYIYKL